MKLEYLSGFTKKKIEAAELPAQKYRLAAGGVLLRSTDKAGDGQEGARTGHPRDQRVDGQPDGGRQASTQRRSIAFRPPLPGKIPVCKEPIFYSPLSSVTYPPSSAIE